MNRYFERYAFAQPLIGKAPAKGLSMVVVIPCYNEPDILPTLNSLLTCTPPPGEVEVLVVVNEPEGAATAVQQQNRQTLHSLKKWQAEVKPWFALHSAYLTLPAKTAGVGLARKAGMDDAARRFEVLGKPHGVIVCLDADCTVAPNYLTAIYYNFYRSKQPPIGAVVYYEHPLPKESRLRSGIVQYELHLRYYVQALVHIGYPFAHHTVGSTIVVRQDAYLKAGGMNKRQAGEDFYFLHKLMPLGKVVAITGTTVWPAGRPSDRVPFGTGRAMRQWLQKPAEHYDTYSLQSFLDLGALLLIKEKFYRANRPATEALLSSLPASVQAFLQAYDYRHELARLNRQSTTGAIFTRNWLTWLDGFKVLKYLHFTRDHFYPNAPITQEAHRLAGLRWPDEKLPPAEAEALLDFYRQQERNNNLLP